MSKSNPVTPSQLAETEKARAKEKEEKGKVNNPSQASKPSGYVYSPSSKSNVPKMSVEVAVPRWIFRYAQLAGLAASGECSMLVDYEELGWDGNVLGIQATTIEFPKQEGSPGRLR